MRKKLKVLVVDVNNFARYPTVGVGYVVALLRQDDMDVGVFSPLASGVSGMVREAPTRRWGLIDQRIRYRTAVSRNRWVQRARSVLAKRHGPELARERDAVFARFLDRLDADEYDVVLVSAYLMYYDLVADIGEACKERKIPLLVGGPYFATPEVTKEWLGLPGLSGIAVGEVEEQLPSIVRAVASRESLEDVPGLAIPGQAYLRPPPPVKDLDTIPFPDYSDFPWDAYPNRIAPMITGRGCGWGKCAFCSDITSTIGRTYRSRTPQNVLDEVQLHAERYNTKLFVFTDLKLNSDQAVWKALHKEMQRIVPGAQWVCAIHIPADGSDGLTRKDLEEAAASGLVRLTTGFESGSTKVLEAMNKGTNLDQMSQTLANANAAGISVRVTMIVGYPGETAEDVLASARYLEKHADTIERVMFNRLQMMTGTILHRGWQAHPSRYPDLRQVRSNHRLAQLDHEFAPNKEPEYLSAIDRLLAAVHAINRKPLKETARAFEGVM